MIRSEGDRTAARCLAGCAAAALAQAAMLALPPFPAAMPRHTSMLSVHLLLELFAIVIALLIVTVSWHTFSLRAHRPGHLLIAGFIVVATCDLVHALTYDGMPPLLGDSSTVRAIFFWLMGRSVEAATLGLIALGWAPRMSRSGALAAGLAGSALLVWIGSSRLELFPVTFVKGSGVTPFKAVYEVGLCGLNALVALALWRRAKAGGQSRYLLLATSAWVIGVGELSFTSYVAPSDFQNIFGHAYKIVAYALLYWATFIGSLRAPFEALKVSEHRASEGEQRIRSLSDNLPNCVVYQVVREADGSMRFLHVSEAVERLTGIPVSEVLEDPSSLYRATLADDRAAVAAAERRSAETMQVFDIEVRQRHRDGRVRWMRLVSAPRRLADGRICWDGVQTDITERRSAEMRSREHEATLAAVIDSASDAVISTDPAGRITLFNPAAERIFGHAAAALLGKPLDMLLPAAERARHGAQLARFAASGVSSRRMGTGRVPGLRADGAELELEASISQVTVNEHQVLTAILRDVTERSRTERALLRYQFELTGLTHQLMAQEKATTRRLAQVLHDQLGQTLTAIRIDFVAEARFADPLDAARHARVDRLIDQAVREVRQVLVELRPTLLDERGLFEALDNELATRRLSAGGVDLVLDADAATVDQRWDADAEYAAFMVAREAVANALQHARPTRVQVSLAGGPGRFRLEVADNGSGLAADARTARPGHLGMIGMRERSIAIGARFEVQSAPGAGTTVSLDWSETAG